ncbi:MAG: hypothetical protein HUJ53_04860 [Holdemanella sp.]|nr:hypothetical protein [Holdemanella sp.]
MNSKWIWCESAKKLALEKPIVVIFRKKITCQNVKEASINLSADSHYKMYVNGNLVHMGPAKGDKEVWFYDSIDLKPYLKDGDNVLVMYCLHYPQDPANSNQSLMATAYPGLYIDGTIQDENGMQDISADESYLCHIDTQRELVRETKGFAPLFIYENYQANELWDVHTLQFDDSLWEASVPYPKRVIRMHVSPGNLNERRIPLIRLIDRKFKGSVKGNLEASFIEGKDVIVKKNTKVTLDLDAGEEMCAYLKLVTSYGKGSKIQILQSESYYQEDHVKRDRMDFIHGHLEGYSDLYSPSGNEKEVYEPLWYRTFRYVQLTIETKDEDLILHSFDFKERGYPLEIKSHVKTSDDTLDAIWDISERTLRRCMHENYVDCPFYEQLQYIMDTRGQILYTYASSMDDRLARQALDDFKRSQRYDGLLYSAYPNTRPNVIPGFSMYYIMMVHDHMMYFGDKKLVRNHIPTIENILNTFEDGLTDKGYVKTIGNFYGGRFWGFIDWAGDWQVGVPNAAKTGMITMENLLYILGLQKASELFAFAGYKEKSELYLQQAESIKKAICTYCIGDNGMIMDGDNYPEYSQHCQVFGALTGVVEKEQARENLLETILHPDQYAQCSVSMQLYLFEALRITGLYEYTDVKWNIWRNMIKRNATTSFENELDERSDCHAWGSLALYELPSVVLGVHPAAPGYSKIAIKPVPGYLEYAKGEVVTPYGMVKVSWKKQDGNIQLDYTAPEGVEIVI